VTSEEENLLEDGGQDQVLAFTVSARNARGRFVRLGPTLDAILSAHDYPGPIKHVLSEALVLTAIMGSLLKEAGSQLTFQIQAEGAAIDLLVCDFRMGELRGYVRFDEDCLAGVGANPSLAALFGEGYLAVTFDLTEADERYQGIVRVEGDTLSEACEAYFSQSEQVPTILRAGIRSEGGRTIASGMLIQHFPDGEEGKARLDARSDALDWGHVSVLASSIRHDELVDPGLSLEQLVWRLFHAEGEIRVEPISSVKRGCRCTSEHFKNVLMRFPEDERATMRDSEGFVPVDCAFCSRIFQVAV
jgi:molecular chaperone Hsp33